MFNEANIVEALYFERMGKSSLPKGWRLVKFGDLAESITERVDDPKAAGVEIYVGLEHLDSDTTKISRFGTPEDVESTKLRFYPGDVIYARRRAYQRKLGVAEVEGICSAHALVLRARREVCLPEFLPYFLQSDQFHERALSISVGSLSPTINWKTLVAQDFVLPPIAEQRRIVELISLIDVAIGNYQSIDMTVIINSIINEICNNSNTVKPLSAVAQLIGGGTPLTSKNEYWGSEICWATPSDLTNLNGFHISSTSRQITALGLKSSSTKLLPAGSVLLTTRASIGFVAMNEIDMCINQGITGLVCSSKILPKFLMYQLLGLRSELEKMTAGSTFPEITRGRLAGLTIHTPSISIQEVAIEKIDELLNLGASISSEIKCLRSIRKAALDSETLYKQVANV